MIFLCFLASLHSTSDKYQTLLSAPHTGCSLSKTALDVFGLKNFSTKCWRSTKSRKPRHAGTWVKVWFEWYRSGEKTGLLTRFRIIDIIKNVLDFYLKKERINFTLYVFKKYIYQEIRKNVWFLKTTKLNNFWESFWSITLFLPDYKTNFF